MTTPKKVYPRDPQKRGIHVDLHLDVWADVHAKLRSAAEARGVKMGAYAGELILRGLENAPPPSCSRCGQPAALCPACVVEAEDVAIVRNRLSTEASA